MLKAAFLLMALGSFAGVYGAPIIPPCAPGNIYTFESTNPNGCTVGNVTFSNFSELEGDVVEGTEFTMSPTSSGSGAGFNVQFTDAGTGLHTTTGVVNFAIQYFFDPPPAIGSAFLSLDVSGDVTVTEAVCPGGQFTNVNNPNDTTDCFVNGLDPEPTILTVMYPNGNLSAFATFAPVTTGEVRLIFNLDGTTINGPAGFDTVTATLSSTPEPATFLLLLGGLIGIGAYKRRARQ